MVSVALFAFAWAAGERSQKLLDRIFVRLNLTFIILASLIMLLTAGMEKYLQSVWSQNGKATGEKENGKEGKQ